MIIKEIAEVSQNLPRFHRLDATIVVATTSPSLPRRGTTDGEGADNEAEQDEDEAADGNVLQADPT